MHTFRCRAYNGNKSVAVKCVVKTRVRCPNNNRRFLNKLLIGVGAGIIVCFCVPEGLLIFICAVLLLLAGFLLNCK